MIFYDGLILQFKLCSDGWDRNLKKKKKSQKNTFAVKIHIIYKTITNKRVKYL